MAICFPPKTIGVAWPFHFYTRGRGSAAISFLPVLLGIYVAISLVPKAIGVMRPFHFSRRQQGSWVMYGL